MVSLGLTALIASAVIGQNAPACAQPDTAATVRSTPFMPPTMLLAADEHGTVPLIVTLTPESTKPSSVELVQSSGSVILDAAAIEAVRQTQFTAETRSCVAVGGRYFYDFVY